MRHERKKCLFLKEIYEILQRWTCTILFLQSDLHECAIFYLVICIQNNQSHYNLLKITVNTS